MRKSARFLKGGFTLVELLVVIAIIGVLAAVLLIGINPIEQMNKAKDAGRLSRAKEVISAAERYYTARAGTTYTEPTCLAGATNLVTIGELKTGGCADITLSGGAGSYTATFTPVSSTTYQTICSGKGSSTSTTLCEVPADFQ